MSIELPEAHILAIQMDRELKGKRIAGYALQNVERMQKLGMFNRNRMDYERLIRRDVELVTSRGLVVRVKLDAGENLLLAPEYGGKILYHPKAEGVPGKFHFKLGFADGSAFSVALSGFGGVQVFSDVDLNRSYFYKRDFSVVPCPTSKEDFLFEPFKAGLASKNVNIKKVLVGKDALVVGLGNSAFQDILFRAGIHPQRKASSLTGAEAQALYDAVNNLVRERINAGGKSQFVDFYGKPGVYQPTMSSDMRGQQCRKCGVSVQAANLGGGVVFFCPQCQK